MNYMKYNRALVMLEEQNSSFCAKEGPVKGHLKVETGNGKGALRCTVQNLRYYPRGEYIYKLILFGKKGERTLHAIVGNLVVNRFGNSETYFRFNPMDVDDKGSRYSDYFTAIVAAVSTRDSTEPLHPVLKGNLENEGEQGEPGPRPSAESLIKAASAEPAASQTVGPNDQDRPDSAISQTTDSSGQLCIDPAVSQADGSNSQLPPEPAASQTAGANDQDRLDSAISQTTDSSGQLHTDPAVSQADGSNSQLPPEPAASQTAGADRLLRPQMEPKEAAQIQAEEGGEALESGAAQAVQANPLMPETDAAQPVLETTEPRTAPKPEAGASSQGWETTHNYNGFYNEYLLNVCGYTCKVADYFEEVHPFESDRTKARWKKVVNVANLPLVSPGARHFAAQYRHYLFGARPGKDGKAERFYFGIPGRFLETEQPDGGRSGFTFWQPMRGTDREKTAYGYWIVSVDARTGNIEDV